MSIVLLARLDQGSAIALLLLVSAYETGDFLVGSGARNPYEGPAAGASAIVVITFVVSTLPISTLGFGEAWLFGGVVAGGAPLGQILASALLPVANAPATAPRRLDSLLLVAPGSEERLVGKEGVSCCSSGGCRILKKKKSYIL